jgi:dTDP-4-dehydrorhamnose reductase
MILFMLIYDIAALKGLYWCALMDTEHPVAPSLHSFSDTAAKTFLRELYSSMILVTGAGGQVGKTLQSLAAQFPQLQLIFTHSDTLDITNKRAVSIYCSEMPLSACINCAAYTAVDRAEGDPLLARRVNVGGVANLATACAKANIPLIHFSSDYVYHNNLNRPLVETDPTAPKGVYARSKLKGEYAALQRHANTMIVRTSWVYAPEGHNFVRTILRLASEKPSIGVVYDQIGAPTYAPDMAFAILNLLQKIQTGNLAPEQLSGIWNYANAGVTSWYDFAWAILSHIKSTCTVHPIRSEQYPTPATRPPFSVLDTTKFKTAFEVEIPHWQDSLQRCLKAMGN